MIHRSYQPAYFGDRLRNLEIRFARELGFAETGVPRLRSLSPKLIHSWFMEVRDGG